MKTKIKYLAYSASVAALTMPALVMAQFALPPNTTKLPGRSVTVLAIITRIMNWLLIVVGLAGVIGFAIAGILYLTSAGDETRIGTAKNAMLYSIVGVVVALAGLVALQFAQNLLGGTNF
jgi:hypothetical protein